MVSALSPSRYKDREGLAPAAYLARYHGPQSEASNPTELVGSVREAVQLASGTHTRQKPVGRAAYVDQEREILFTNRLTCGVVW